MSPIISARLLEVVDALPLKNGIRILEIGCGPGVAAREIVHRLEHGFVLAIDRSAKAIEQAISGSATEIATGKLTFKQATIEGFKLEPYEDFFDLAFAIRVGALDGRHPQLAEQALRQIAKVLKPNGQLFIDGGNPLKTVFLDKYRPKSRL